MKKSAKFDVNRVLRRIQEGKGTLDEFEPVAEHLGVPLWVLFVPGIAGPDVNQTICDLVALMEGYLKAHAEGVSVQARHTTLGAAQAA